MHERPTSDERRLAVHIVSASTTLVGVCLTVTGALWVVNRLQGINTIADTLLAIDALASTIACLLAYASLRSRGGQRAMRLERAADISFLIALSLMSVMCGVIAYEII